MNNFIFIEKKDPYLYTGVFFSQELRKFKRIEESHAINGNIYRGRLVKILDNMNSGFIDIGLEKNAFINLSDIGGGRKKPGSKMSDYLKEGETVMVQVIREAIDTKGPKVSMNLEFSNENLVLLSDTNKVRISRKIKDEEKRNSLREIGYRIKNREEGLIIRSDAINLNEDLLKEDYEKLRKKKEEILKEINFLPVPKLVSKSSLKYMESISKKDLARADYIITNDQDIYRELKLELGEDLIDIRLDEDFSIKYSKEILADLKKALSREISLESGGSIILDQTEAFQLIDINSGGSYGHSLEETVNKINLQAVEESFKQIILRDLSGIILIDLLKLEGQNNYGKLIERLEELIEEEGDDLLIAGISQLSILQLTRRRRGQSLLESLKVSCPRCKGKGVEYEIF